MLDPMLFTDLSYPSIHRIPNTHTVFHNESEAFTAGHLKLKAYMNCGLLTIHVVKARELRTQDLDKAANTRIEVLISPSLVNMACVTEVITNTDSPVYDHKFSFELFPEDERKRIQIHVLDVERSELIGCMSFGIKSILLRKRHISGWYHLLPLKTGSRKHRCVLSGAVPPTIFKQDDFSHTTQTSLSPERLAMCISRSTTGYGFTLMGSRPCRVSRVHVDGGAFAAGLQAGDKILSVNNQPVEAMSAFVVATIIKESRHFTELVVEREMSSTMLINNVLRNS